LQRLHETALKGETAVKQGVSPAVAVVVILIVVIVVAAIGYFVFMKPKAAPGGGGGTVDYSSEKAPEGADKTGAGAGALTGTAGKDAK
jgi:flagellar basal body-associated protein FliL